MTMGDRRILDEQIAYYRARAGEYDEWWFRQGRYDRGEEQRQAWFAEVAQVEAALRQAGPAGHVLELACGTGLWTRHLVDRAESLTAVDASPEVLRLNAEHRLEEFWRMVHSALRPGGQAFFVDNLFGQEQTATDHKDIDRRGVVERKLNDGRTFSIVKIFYEPAGLEQRLGALGWSGYVRTTGRFFLYGCVRPNA